MKRVRGEGAAGGRKPPVNARLAKAAIESLTRRAADGDPGAADELAKWFALCPEYKPAVEAVKNLSAKALEAWVKLAAAGDLLTEQSARDEADAIRAELLPPDAGVVERVLADAIVVARLVLAHATAMAAVGSPNPGVVAARDRRLSAAQDRLFTAVKNWQTVAARRATGVRPPLKVYDPARRTGRDSARRAVPSVRPPRQWLPGGPRGCPPGQIDGV